MPDLTLDHVTKRFGSTAAVDDLNFSVEHGGLIAVLGPSGCGKTTTVRMIAGFEQPDSGRILIDGKDVTHVPPQNRDIGIVFQSYALFPHMTVAENVAFGLEMRGELRGAVRSRMSEALELVRLTGFAARYPRQLSGGQQQRVALARALAIRPRLLLLDEPLSNLDAKLRDEMRDEIRRIQLEVEITAVFVTHDQGEAFGLADRVVVMAAGRLQQYAAPSTIYNEPASAEVGRFIGQANAWSGHVIGKEEACIVVDIGYGTRMFARSSQVGVGDNCVVFLKYERIALARATPDPEDDGLMGRVVSRTFLGETTSYTVDIRGLVLRALIPNRAGFEHFCLGDVVIVSYSLSDVRVFTA